jgi:hypothetical protein
MQSAVVPIHIISGSSQTTRQKQNAKSETRRLYRKALQNTLNDHIILTNTSSYYICCLASFWIEATTTYLQGNHESQTF